MCHVLVSPYLELWDISGGSLGIREVVLGGPWTSKGVPRGTKNGCASLGTSWDGPGKPVRVSLEVWGDPWVSPKKS